ncbi:GNAT family N-acetyltransferase [Actinomyces minihominis]|uniref:GNAT family N-acetyltransferase n=1 Tax=Actinomyces minihominis TaxID=2002838 RepID=UPI0013EB815B|nr:GNAT family N-acetyltransferase [Actinomyces minihominis]
MTSGSPASPGPEVRLARADEAREIAQLYADTFAADPTWTAIVPNQRLRRFTIRSGFLSELKRGSFNYVDVAVDEDDHILGALNYHPPGVRTPRMPAWHRFIYRIAERILPSTRRGMLHDNAVHAHRPEGPHWYFRDLVTSPKARNRGIGTMLLQNRLAEVDKDPLPVFLEATTEGSKRLYERHGFRHVANVTAIPGGTVFIMIRPPQTPRN